MAAKKRKQAPAPAATMTTQYTVRMGTTTMATYREFLHAGHHGVRGVDRDGRSQEYSHRSALDLAEETAGNLARSTDETITIVREDGTVVREWARRAHITQYTSDSALRSGPWAHIAREGR